MIRYNPFRLFRSITVMAAVGTLTSLLTATEMVAPSVSLADTTYSLMPASGQYFPITPVKVLDTRNGTGGVPTGPFSAGATATFPVWGAGQVPDGGAVDVYVVIHTFSSQDSGCIQDYNPDIGNPGICTASYQAGVDNTDSDIVQVSDSSGDMSVTNNSAGNTGIAVTVMGYYQNGDLATNGDISGETYVPVPVAQIVDTRHGLGAPEAQIAGGSSLTIQVTGFGGIPTDALGAALFVGAAGATAPGFVTAYPTGATDASEAILSYAPQRIVRDLYFGALSSDGKLTLVNHGSNPVDLMVGSQGYLLGPAASPAGNAFQDVPETRIVDTRSGTGGVPATPVSAGASITFTATGNDGIPATGIPAVAESVAAINPVNNGFLSVYPADGVDPNEPGVNFNGGDSQDNDIATPVLTTLSPTGQETITNHSSGTVDVVVSVRGYYVAPTVPADPNSVVWSSSDPTSATVSWLAPYSDGGSPLTGYTVTAPPDDVSVTVGPDTTQATLTGLTNANSDDFTVTADNEVGSSSPAPVSSLAQDYVGEQDLGIEVDDNGDGTPTVSLLAGSSTVSIMNSDGTVSTSITTAQTGNYYSDMPLDGATGPTGVTCDYDVHKSAGNVGHAIKTLGSFNNVRSDSFGQIYWVNHLFALPKARVRNGVMQWEAFACTSGGGKFFSASGLATSISENALFTNSTDANTLWNYDYSNQTLTSSSVTASKDLTLGGTYEGANVSVDSGQSVTVRKGDTEATGSLGLDGHYGSFMPTALNKYYPTRVNTEWRSLGPSYNSTDFVGSVSVAIWLYPQHQDNDHKFYSVTILFGCDKADGSADCGNYNGDTSHTGS